MAEPPKSSSRPLGSPMMQAPIPGLMLPAAVGVSEARELSESRDVDLERAGVHSSDEDGSMMSTLAGKLPDGRTNASSKQT
eukprot:COSAG02_NODE_67376_length_253_cov_0.668831_1_plen_80_part_10